MAERMEMVKIRDMNIPGAPLFFTVFASSVPSYISIGWISLEFGLPTVLFTVFATASMLYSVVATAVLFIYCKALRGELELEMVDEFASLYVRLPFDGDDKVPKVVYVV